MKKLATMVALAAFIATPAFAQKSARYLAMDWDEVVTAADGTIVGQDPDLNIRLDLQRQAEFYAHHSQ
jgi:hypothetical protein